VVGPRTAPVLHLDIAILPDRPLDSWERIERALDFRVRVHRDVDLVDLARVSDLLRYEVVTGASGSPPATARSAATCSNSSAWGSYTTKPRC
jgi:hypothetical protein